MDDRVHLALRAVITTATQSGLVDTHVIVRRTMRKWSDHYYIGRAKFAEAVETQMAGRALPVVEMTLKFGESIRQCLFDHFHPLA